MALKVSSNLQDTKWMMTNRITLSKLRGWATAGLIGAGQGYKGDTGKKQPFDKFIIEHYLNDDSILGRHKEDAWWKKYSKGWHHADQFGFYVPVNRGRYKDPELHMGIYTTRSLNYLSQTAKRGAIKDSKYIRKSWRAYSGTADAKEEIAWFIQHGIEKMARNEVSMKEMT